MEKCRDREFWFVRCASFTALEYFWFRGICSVGRGKVKVKKEKYVLDIDVDIKFPRFDKTSIPLWFLITGLRLRV